MRSPHTVMKSSPRYSHEAKKGELLQLFCAFDDEAKKITVVGKQFERICFESELYYQ